MYYNNRLHQRRPGEHGEHYQGCALHDLEQQRNTRNSLSPLQSNGSSHHSSMSSLYQRKSRQSTPSSVEKRHSNDNNSNSSVQSKSSHHNSDDSLSRFKALVYESSGNNESRTKSVQSLNNKRNNSQKTFGPVQIKSCDSPDHIIATLFPVTEFITGGKGKCNNRSVSIDSAVTPRKDYRNMRAKSISSDHSSTTKSRSDKPNGIGRLLSVERDFVNLR